MTCRCGYPECQLNRRDHFCSVCGEPHYTAIEAFDCCDTDVSTDG